MDEITQAEASVPARDMIADGGLVFLFLILIIILFALL